MKKLIIISGLAILGLFNIKAQQSPLFTQYMFNPYSINPAIAGTYPYYSIRMLNRFQWIKFTDAPVTNVFSFFGPLSAKRKNMGVGGTFFSDIVGPTSQTALYGSYSYFFNINSDMRLAGGLSAGMMQYRIDGTQFNQNSSLIDNSDVVLYKSENNFIPDATFGLYLWTNEYHIGFSVDKLFNSKLNFFNQNTSLSRLRSHFYLTSSYRYILNRRWVVVPGIILKGVYPAPPQLDINCHMLWKNVAWFGLTGRTGDGISIFGGYVYAKKIRIGMAYDYPIFSDIRTYNNLGTVEMLIGYQFDNLK